MYGGVFRSVFWHLMYIFSRFVFYLLCRVCSKSKVIILLLVLHVLFDIMTMSLISYDYTCVNTFLDKESNVDIDSNNVKAQVSVSQLFSYK